MKLPRRTLIGQLGLGTAALALGGASSAAATNPSPLLGYGVRDFGALGDGRRLDTGALQAAIDTCAAAGGGTVVFPAGRYLSGTLFLKDRVVLHLEAGATLLGSTELKDYPPRTPAFRSYTDVNYVERSLIYAEKVSHIGIVGQGTIHGQGEAKAFQLGGGGESYKRRPYLIRMIECQHVTLRDVTIRNSPMWVQHYLACDDVVIDGITVDSTVNANNDGIDIDGCQRVRIANCRITSGDDAIVLKSTAPRACRGVTITNCILSSHCNAFKCGTESTGGFLDIALSNCVIQDTHLSGIALEMVDGGTLDGVMISNVRMSRTKGGLFLRLGNRARPYLAKGPGGGDGTHVHEEGMKPPGIGRFRNVQISQVTGDGVAVVGCAIAGLPEHPIENVTLDQVRLEFVGGGRSEDAAREVPEKPAAYPEYGMFGRLPAYALYCRHVKNLRLYRLEAGLASPDARPALICDDVEDLELEAWRSAMTSAESPEVSLRNVRNAWIHGCQPSPNARVFVQVEGKESRNLRLAANATRDSSRLVSLSPDVPADTVTTDLASR